MSDKSVLLSYPVISTQLPYVNAPAAPVTVKKAAGTLSLVLGYTLAGL